MNVPYHVPLDVGSGARFTLGINVPGSASLDVGTGIYAQIGEHYQGAYNVTPSDTAQVLDTSGLIMDGNITVDPIPSNYGLITWDGSTITVS